MITSFHNLQGNCKVCGIRADWMIEKTNDDLPDGYFKEGTRGEYYCEAHLPDEAKCLIDSAIANAQRPFGA